MELKLFIDVAIQPERFETIEKVSTKYNLFKKYNIKTIENIEKCDLILFLVNSRNNLINLKEDHYLFQTTKPVILLERQDSSISWVREFDKIKNLKAVFKNRKLKPKELQNSDQVYYGKYNTI